MSGSSNDDFLEEWNRFNQVLQVFAHLSLLNLRIALDNLVYVLLDHLDCSNEDPIAASRDQGKFSLRLEQELPVVHVFLDERGQVVVDFHD